MLQDGRWARSHHEPTSMESTHLSIHTYRKRKFFAALAELLDEPVPTIKRLQDVFSAIPEETVNASPAEAEEVAVNPSPSPPTVPEPQTPAQDGSHVTSTVAGSFQSSEDESFDYVDFNKSRASTESSLSLRSQSSLHDSMQDSIGFLPSNLQHSPDLPHETTAYTAQHTTTPTILHCVVPRRPVELSDYFASDRYCESVPCWTDDTHSSCPIHVDPIRRPMLLFCLQALDEYIASTTLMDGHDNVLVESCRLARVVFASMWEHDVMKTTTDPDIVLAEYLSQRLSIIGVSIDVWRVIDRYWRKYQPNYLHHQDLSFSDNDSSSTSTRHERWQRIRQLLQIYGLRPSQARHFVSSGSHGMIGSAEMESLKRMVPSTVPVEVGLAFQTEATGSSPQSPSEQPSRRGWVSQQDWKLAFRIIEQCLKKASDEIKVFPCGSFSRGAAYGSVIDILISLPPGPESDGTHSLIASVLDILVRATIVQRDRSWKLSPHRLLAIISFKSSIVILDVKVYRQPQSWFALLYYTGPESFTERYFSTLLKSPLNELSVVDFDHIYARVVGQVGRERLASIDEEQALFNLIGTTFVLQTHRI